MVCAVPVFPPIADPYGLAFLPLRLDQPSSITVALQYCLILSDTDSDTVCFKTLGSIVWITAPFESVIELTR